MDVDVHIKRVNGVFILVINQISINISDYLIKSSADGTTELVVTIRGVSSTFELSSNLEE